MCDYDAIGAGYAAARVPDRSIAVAIRAGLGDVQSVVNVGAGTGSYEPTELEVVAVEPSMNMIRQRPVEGARVVQARAERLPFPDKSFDAALAVLTVHHWEDWRAGVAEMKRVARQRVVVMTRDFAAATGFWLLEYFPEIARVDAVRFMDFAAFCEALAPCRVANIRIPHDCTDGFLGAYWRRPNAYLDPAVRAGMSCFSLGIDPQPGLSKLAKDLETGRWSKRWGHLLNEESHDLGYRLVVSEV